MNKIIVSFTSYPKRISTIHHVLDSIIEQTIMPDRIVLYLSSSEFQRFDDMPSFEKYKKYGFEIHWVEENIKSHKKWFYAFREYPEDIIITIDDDVLYNQTAIENLISHHYRFPKAVIAREIHLITCNNDGSIASYDNWYKKCEKYVGIPRMDLCAIGNGGILYPPHIFSNELFNIDFFGKNCQYADDMWLKIMEVYHNVPVVLVKKAGDDALLMEHQDSCLYVDYNSNGGNDRQLEALLQQYPYTINGEKTLLEGIFENGRIFASEVEVLKMKQMKNVYEALIKKLETYNEILIYGAGFAGNMIYNFLRQNNINSVKAFIVDNREDNPKFIDDIPVKDYREFITSNENIIIALLDKNKAKFVQETLVQERKVDEERVVLLTNDDKKALLEIYKQPFESGKYWEKRYAEGGNSGAGSYNRLATFKAEIINEFVRENNVNLVLEWGCGDGNQLRLAEYPRYVGFDVSRKAVEICKSLFREDSTKEFIYCGGEDFKNNYVGDLVLSLDVIYHLIEDEVYEKYMKRLFDSSKEYVCIYSSNYDEGTKAEHVKHREFTKWIERHMSHEWRLEKFIKNRFPYIESDQENTSFSDFYFYRKLSKNNEEKTI